MKDLDINGGDLDRFLGLVGGIGAILFLSNLLDWIVRATFDSSCVTGSDPFKLRDCEALCIPGKL